MDNYERVVYFDRQKMHLIVKYWKNILKNFVNMKVKLKK